MPYLRCSACGAAWKSAAARYLARDDPVGARSVGAVSTTWSPHGLDEFGSWPGRPARAACATSASSDIYYARYDL